MRMKKWFKTFELKNLDGRVVPNQPFPPVFFISDELFDIAAYKIRPLTFSNFIRSIARNFISMNYWRLMNLLWKLGFLNTKLAEQLSFSHWNWHPLRTRKERSYENKKMVNN